MPYPGQFHRLVLSGSIYTDVFNFGLSIVPKSGGTSIGAVTNGQLSVIAGVVGTWFPKTLATQGPGIQSFCSLKSIKLNRIGPDGKYVDDVTQEWLYPSPIAGSDSGNAPAQVALAVTLRAAKERGRASKGRFYLPPNGATVASLSSGGLVTAASALAQANSARALINLINTAYGSDGEVGIASNAGAGAFERVVSVSVGRVPDTIRSRRSTAVEDYQSVALVA